jgi:hypothetical protein
MPALDESVEKLEGFCRLLALVNDGLRDDTAGVKAREDALERTEDSIDDGLIALDRDLDDLHEGTERGEAEAAGTLEQSEESARRAQARLTAEQAELDEAESTCDQRLDASRTELDQAGARLEHEGRGPLMESLQEAGEGLEASGESAATAFDTLDGVLREETAHVTQAADQAAAAMAGDAASLDGETGQLEGEGERCAGGWSEELPAQLEQGYTAAAEGVTAAYEELSVEAGTAGESLVRWLNDKAIASATLLASDPLSVLMMVSNQTTSALDAYGEGLHAVGDRLVDDGMTLIDELAPATDELVKAKTIIPIIDEVLAALE